MNVLKTIIHLLSTICYILIIIYALICIPYVFGYKPLVVLTGSMEPTFKTGSIIYYKHVNQNELKEGDIITFKMGDYIVSHRINKIDNNLYETKGDANNSVDSRRISYNDIMGKDLNVNIPYLGFYVKYIKENMYLLVVFALILVSDFILSNTKLKKVEMEDNEEKSKKVKKDEK